MNPCKYHTATMTASTMQASAKPICTQSKSAYRVQVWAAGASPRQPSQSPTCGSAGAQKGEGQGSGQQGLVGPFQEPAGLPAQCLLPFQVCNQQLALLLSHLERGGGRGSWSGFGSNMIDELSSIALQ